MSTALAALVGIALWLCTTAQTLPGPVENVECCRIFITGITGMIGSHVAKALLSEDIRQGASSTSFYEALKSLCKCRQVYGLIRPRSDLSSLDGILHKIIFYTGDIDDSKRMKDVVATVIPTHIYHFAAQAINGISFEMPYNTMYSNIQGVLNLFEAIVQAKIRPKVLLAGSSTEYGNTALTYELPLTEDLVLDPISPYGISKLATEQIGKSYYNSAKIHVVIARIFIHVGTGGTDSLAINQFCKQIAMAERGLIEPLILHGNLETERDITNSKDSANAMILLTERGRAGQAYNVGSGRTTSISNILSLAISMARVKVIAKEEKSRFRSFDEKRLVANITKLQVLTGWVPSPDIQDTVSEIMEHWRFKINNLYCRAAGSACKPLPSGHSSNSSSATTRVLRAAIQPELETYERTYRQVLPCLQQSPNYRNRSDWAYPADAEAHFQELLNRTAKFRKTAVHKYGEYSGPWIENIFIERFMSRPLAAFNGLIPLFLQWIDTEIAQRSRVDNILAELNQALRPDVLYVAVSQGDRGLREIGRLHPNILVLSAGGYGHVPLPLIKGELPWEQQRVFEQDIGFYGKVHHSRGAMLAEVQKELGSLRYKHSHGHTWRSEMNVTKFNLAPRGYGRSSFHFSESIQMGRVPVFMYDDLPWVPYNGTDIAADTFGFVCGLGGTGERSAKSVMGAIRTLSTEAYAQKVQALQRARRFYTYDGVVEEIGKLLADPFGPAGGHLRCEKHPKTERCCG